MAKPLRPHATVSRVRAYPNYLSFARLTGAPDKTVVEIILPTGYATDPVIESVPLSGDAEQAAAAFEGAVTRLCAVAREADAVGNHIPVTFLETCVEDAVARLPQAVVRRIGEQSLTVTLERCQAMRGPRGSDALVMVDCMRKRYRCMWASDTTDEAAEASRRRMERLSDMMCEIRTKWRIMSLLHSISRYDAVAVAVCETESRRNLHRKD